MAKIKKQEIEQLLKLIGGADNIVSVSHCITRMRFVLRDTELADIQGIEELPSVKGCFTNAGQFQVVIGPQVDQFHKLFTEVARIGEVNKEELKKVARQNMSVLERTISHFAEIFIPLIPAIVAGGLILGFRNLIGDINLVDGHPLMHGSQFWTGVYNFLWLIGEAIFFFLPVGICWSTVKKLGGTPILGIVLGITLVSPQLMNAYDLGSKIPEVWNFGYFTIAKVGYQAQVIPALLAGLVLAFIETRLKKIIPDCLTLVLVPVLSLILAVFLAHALIGPAGREIGNGVGWVVQKAMTGQFAPIGAALFGFLYAPLVITGVHQTTNAVDLQLIGQMGGTPVFPLIALSNIAQGSAVLGIVLISRKKNEREISVPAVISAYLGVTEPAMYGINLRYKFPMLCAMVGSAIAACICGFGGVLANSIGVGGIPAILSVQTPFWGVYLCAMLVAIVVPVLLTLAVYKRKESRHQLDLGEDSAIAPKVF
ncbi:PTS trehalose transporter subunit IIBC [Dongshaea marina]|uniref:PTS trehalose transporter subunit IIBC n=1 Tax=Dongshaea marina TaxID=2047966 RepID=UPI000D3E6A1D|nr:PTS trehalose transporter subunit IIBC [Dongshaea marina]